MITDEAAQQLLAGLKAEDNELHCYCDDIDCDANHPAEDGNAQPLLGIAFVTPDGQLDTDANQEAFGYDHGELIQNAENAAIELKDYAAWIDDLVVIDRTTGQWWIGTEFPR
ncbi:hypothetical protein [Lentzea sp. NPDC092896]|uniref:hypothetical protein n=1 Tax=Lentzea sp. NPDC092896 TaxID=3364127 RepID=UPI0037F37753